MITRSLFTLTAILLLTFSPAFAGDDAKPADTVKTPELKPQTHCPVMGGKIDSSVYTDIQGQRVYHCCPACSKPLVKDPDKYFQKAAAEGVLFENIQTHCPVSGEALKKKEAYVDYEGRRIYFCCEGCLSKFEKDPQKYLLLLDQAVDDTEAMKHDHSQEDHHGGDNHDGDR